jgi:hypothetical protein
MRLRPLRGEKHTLVDGTLVTTLEPLPKGFIEVVMPNGKITTVPKSTLDLPVIDTRFYEKLDG